MGGNIAAIHGRPGRSCVHGRMVKSRSGGHKQRCTAPSRPSGAVSTILSRDYARVLAQLPTRGTPAVAGYVGTDWGSRAGERLAFELGKFGVRVKTVAPGGIRTDFTGRSLVLTRHPACADLLASVMAVFSDPARVTSGSSAEQIAEVVYEAATDDLDRVTYVAGADG